MRQLRLIDKSGRFVRVLTDNEAASLQASGKAKLDTAGRRPKLVLTSDLKVKDFDRGGAVHKKPTYTERHGGRRLLVLKRVAPDGSLIKWDNDLTFEELRFGKLLSPHRQARIEELERAA